MPCPTRPIQKAMAAGLAMPNSCCKINYAQDEQKREAEALIAEENLNSDAARRYLSISLRREYASEQGTALNELLPKMSPLNPKYLIKKQTVLQKISAFVEKFKGVGGRV